MARKTATAEKQPDLLGEAAPPQIKKADAPAPAKSQAIAKADKPKRTAVAAKPKNDNQERSMLEVIVAIAKDPTVPLDRMQQVMAMQRELEKDKAEREFIQAMFAAQGDMPRVTKDKQNDHTKQWYATLEKVSREIDPVARKNGFVISYGTADSPLANHYRTVADVSHIGGHTKRYFLDLESDVLGPSGKPNKNKVQGVSSSISFARRVLKLLIFDVVPVGDDQDGNLRKLRAQVAGDPVTETADDGAPKITDVQCDKLIEMIEDAGGTRKKFCEVYGIVKIADLPADMFDAAVQSCLDLKASKAKR